MSIKTVYFDMDGVLADLSGFVYGYAQEYHGVTGSLTEHRHDADSIHRYYLLAREHFGLYPFFRGLPPLRLVEMRETMARLHEAGLGVEILTSYGIRDPMEMGDEVHRGKADFLREHYGDLIEDGTLRCFNGVSKSFQKAFYANGRSLLIDDWSKNINAWRATGAPAVHYHLDRHDESIRELFELVGLAPEQWG